MNDKVYHVVVGEFQKKEQVDIDEIVSEDALSAALSGKLTALHAEMQGRMDAVVPVSNSKSKDKLLARQIKLVLKKLESRASANEIAELAASEELDDYLDGCTDAYDDAEAWLEDALRTLAEIEAYDVVTTPTWPVLGA